MALHEVAVFYTKDGGGAAGCGGGGNPTPKLPSFPKTPLLGGTPTATPQEGSLGAADIFVPHFMHLGTPKYLRELRVGEGLREVEVFREEPSLLAIIIINYYYLWRAEYRVCLFVLFDLLSGEVTQAADLLHSSLPSGRYPNQPR